MKPVHFIMFTTLMVGVFLPGCGRAPFPPRPAVVIVDEPTMRHPEPPALPGEALYFVPGSQPGCPWPFDYHRLVQSRQKPRKPRLLEGGRGLESESAVAQGLNWLIRVQNPDGRWSLVGNFPDAGTELNDVAGTALGLLPFLCVGKTHRPAKDNPFDEPVAKALKWLLAQQKATGEFSGSVLASALATLALAQVRGVTGDETLHLPLEKAVAHLLQVQNPRGGWPRHPGERSDLLTTGWTVLALKAAVWARSDVPHQCFVNALRYLEKCRTTTEGYGNLDRRPRPTLSAVGLVCQQFLQGWGPTSLQLQAGIDNHLREQAGASHLFFTTLVFYRRGGDDWRDWLNQLSELAVKTQERMDTEDVPRKGSWSPGTQAENRAGGRLFTTALTLLALELRYYAEMATRNRKNQE